jgi:hypothetical protein
MAKRMMDIRDKILATLQEKPGHTFSISQIAHSVGAPTKSMSAALGKLLNVALLSDYKRGNIPVR